MLWNELFFLFLNFLHNNLGPINTCHALLIHHDESMTILLIKGKACPIYVGAISLYLSNPVSKLTLLLGIEDHTLALTLIRQLLIALSVENTQYLGVMTMKILNNETLI